MPTSYGPLVTPQTPGTMRAKRRSGDLFNARGPASRPASPRNIIVTGAHAALTVKWDAPTLPLANYVTGWRVYLDTESNLIGSISDAALTTYQVSVSDTHKHNIFVSSLNRLGLESRKVQAQGSATS